MGLSRRAATLGALVTAALGIAWSGCGGEDDNSASEAVETTTAVEESPARQAGDEAGPAEPQAEKADRRGDAPEPALDRQQREQAAELRRSLIESIRDGAATNGGDPENLAKRLERIRNELRDLRGGAGGPPSEQASEEQAREAREQAQQRDRERHQQEAEERREDRGVGVPGG